MSGTNTPRDFVEFPSQFNENWALEPSVLANYAKHYQTGAPMPAGARREDQEGGHVQPGLRDAPKRQAAALLDLAWHTLPADAKLPGRPAFEAAALKKYKVDLTPVPPRYHSTYFSHIWGNGYSARLLRVSLDRGARRPTRTSGSSSTAA